MKIALGCDGNTLDSPIAKRFGHAEYYILYDVENGSFDAVKNSHDDEGEHHSHDNLLTLVDDGAEAFVVGNIGPHAWGTLKQRNVDIYLARKMTAKEAIDKFNKGELEKLTEPTAKKSIGHH